MTHISSCISSIVSNWFNYRCRLYSFVWPPPRFCPSVSSLYLIFHVFHLPSSSCLSVLLWGHSAQGCISCCGVSSFVWNLCRSGVHGENGLLNQFAYWFCQWEKWHQMAFCSNITPPNKHKTLSDINKEPWSGSCMMCTVYRSDPVSVSKAMLCLALTKKKKKS